MVMLTVNAGSSSIRLTAFEHEPGRLERVAADRVAFDQRDPRERLQWFMERHGIPRFTSVVHRVVHGGANLIEPQRVNRHVEAEIERSSEIAPLHNRRALRWIHACEDVMGTEVPQVVVFDTAFFASLPAVAATYALPRELNERHGLRRYGFHGIAHQAMWRRWRALHPAARTARVITLQLGAGCSMTAIRDGVAVDTSMGFSPVEGLVMATRSGDVDPGLLPFLQRVEALSLSQLELLLNQGSGLLGLSGVSGDMQQLLALDTEEARLAVDVYCYRARKYLGAYLAVLGGADAIVFGGGVGENTPLVRARILAGAEWCGLRLDTERNEGTVGHEGRITADDSAIEAWVLPVDEATVMAEEGLRVVTGLREEHR